MRQLERRRVRKLLDAKHRGIKLSDWEVKFLWSIFNSRKKNETPLSEKQEKALTSIWEKYADQV